MVARLVINYTQVDVGEEFARDISHFLVPRVVVNGVPVVVGVSLTQLHVVHSDAIVGQCLTVHITDSLADLKEFFVGLHGLFEFAEVVEQDTR